MYSDRHGETSPGKDCLFNSDVLTINHYPFDSISMSETWLENNLQRTHESTDLNRDTSTSGMNGTSLNSLNTLLLKMKKAYQ